MQPAFMAGTLGRGFAAHPAFGAGAGGEEKEARAMSANYPATKRTDRAGKGRRSRAGRAIGHHLGKPAGRGASAPAQPRGALYAEGTQKIIAELEAGRCPSVQPRANGPPAPGLP